MKNLEDDIAQLEADIQAADEQLNDQVADYYGLDESDRQVIAEFLQRFSAGKRSE